MTQQPDIHAVCILNHHEAWAALRMIREALEQALPARHRGQQRAP
jgi:hypothetical protein